MQIAAIDHVEMTAGRRPDSFTIVHQTASLPAVGLLVTSALAATMVLLPAGMIAAHAASHPQALTLIADRAGSAALLVAGMIIVLALLALPVASGIARLERGATVRFFRGRVEVEEQGLTGTRAWSGTIGEFMGVAHHIRATLSGPRHEIVLVHGDRRRDILLAVGHRAPATGADHFAECLGLAEIPARALYGRRGQVASQVRMSPVMTAASV